MTSVLKVFVIDPQNPAKAPMYDPTPRLINITDFETMKKSAIDILSRANYKVRSLNHTPNGELIAYVYSKDVKVMSAQPIAGWVFKRPAVKSEV